MLKPANMLILSSLGAMLCLLLAACPPAMGNVDWSAKAEQVYAKLPEAAEATKLAEHGEKLFNSQACGSCHATATARGGLMGPPLGGVGAAVTARHQGDELAARRWMYKHIRDPQKWPGPHHGSDEYKGSAMPCYRGLQDQDVSALVEFLWTLR
jgi:cytochrome c2